ncbi:MAG TPA: type II toxin-antitoxin system RelB/DinJ family antitoxin [Steroidobacteraceae bacterium]|jgi:addiction module RelB/DinJ family antitoxin
MKKDSVVRARIDARLKAQASKVLAACGLELSDSIRLYLQQVVLQGGIPFPVDSHSKVHYVQAEQLWEMKRAAQVRDHEIAARQDLSGGEMLLIRPDQLRGAKIKWSAAKLSD